MIVSTAIIDAITARAFGVSITDAAAMVIIALIVVAIGLLQRSKP